MISVAVSAIARTLFSTACQPPYTLPKSDVAPPRLASPGAGFAPGSLVCVSNTMFEFGKGMPRINCVRVE
jgi:hypothetical protein